MSEAKCGDLHNIHGISCENKAIPWLHFSCTTINMILYVLFQLLLQHQEKCYGDLCVVVMA
jgi:hypothetical protein